MSADEQRDENKSELESQLTEVAKNFDFNQEPRLTADFADDSSDEDDGFEELPEENDNSTKRKSSPSFALPSSKRSKNAKNSLQDDEESENLQGSPRIQEIAQLLNGLVLPKGEDDDQTTISKCDDNLQESELVRNNNAVIIQQYIEEIEETRVVEVKLVKVENHLNKGKRRLEKQQLFP